MVNNRHYFLPLCTLELHGFPLPWHLLFNLCGVTTLPLHQLPLSSQQNLLEFLTTLSCMQALAVLYLEHAFPSACDFLSDGAFAISLKVSLPCLAYLFIHPPPLIVIALPSCMDIPLKAQIMLEIKLEHFNSIDDFTQFPLVLA